MSDIIYVARLCPSEQTNSPFSKENPWVNKKPDKSTVN